MIALFSAQAADLSVELTVQPTSRFRDLIESRSVDVALGPPAMLREQQRMLGRADGEIARLLRHLAIPDRAQRIFQSDAAALEAVQRTGGMTVALGFTVAKDLAGGRLVQLKGAALQEPGEWWASTLPPSACQPVVTELLNFITTPRFTQAMLRGAGVEVTRFRPAVHVTLWS